jgi:hypothetical protein
VEATGTTSGWAYTWPVTWASNSVVKPGTTDGPIAVSDWSQPVRMLSSEAVTSPAAAEAATAARAVSRAWARATPEPGAAPVSTGSIPSVSASPASATNSNRAEL